VVFTRRKLLALLCALTLAAGLSAPMASAAGTVYFTAVSDDSVLELSDATMPFWNKGFLYVAGSLFNSKTLGTAFIYNPAQGLVVVYFQKTPSYALFFDLNRNAVDDNEGLGYYPPAVVRNSVAFVPVDLVCDYFGLTWSNTKVPNGYMIRVCDPSAILSDQAFADAASYNLDMTYRRYLASKEPPEPAEPVTPEDPVITEEPAGKRRVALCFHPESRESLEALLGVLDARDTAGSFFLTAEDIAGWGDLARRIVASGHSVGLLADAGAAETAEAQLAEANRALWQAAGAKTRLCYLENAKAEDRSAAEAAGYCVLRPDINASDGGMSGTSGGEALFQRLDGLGEGGTAAVWLGGRAGLTGLREFLRLAEAAEDRIVGLRETWGLAP